MEDKMKSEEIYNSANFNCTTYWKYRNGDKVPFEEPTMKPAQYEMGIKETEWGNKIWIKLFSRIGEDPLHKRDYYTYLEFPLDCNFSTNLYRMLESYFKKANNT